VIGQKLLVFRSEIVTDDCDDPRLGEIACGQGNIRCRSPQHPIYAAVGCFDAVVGNRTYHYK